jgi:hypothetical protein
METEFNNKKYNEMQCAQFVSAEGVTVQPAYQWMLTGPVAGGPNAWENAGSPVW